MKTKKLFSLLLLSIFYSCQESDNAIYTPLPEAKVLTDCELIFRFDTEYPLQVQEKDSLLFLTSRKSDKCITVINKNTKSVSQKFANRGMGPNDAIDPVFIVNNYLYNDSLLLTNANSGRFFTIKMDSTNHFQLNGNGFFPDKIYRSSNLNFCDNLIIGRDVTSNQNMFFIYDQNNQSIKEIKYRPFLEGLKANMNYYSATNIAANPERNVIVTAMYHMDLVHLYDFQGNLKKSIQFSENPVPRVNEEREALALEEGYNGTSFIFPSENYLYLKRSHVEVEKKGGSYIPHETFTIVKLDWDGNVIGHYSFDEEIGFFCVNEKNSDLYIIVHTIEGMNEYYDLKKYKI